MNYFEKHIGDYIKDTVSLSMLEDGAYNRLIDQCYQTERPLPVDRKEVYREARASTATERKAVDYVLGKFFEQREDGFVQKRIVAEISRFQDKQRKAKASADARWSKDKTHSEGNANASETHHAIAMRTHCEGNALQTPETIHQTPEIKRTPLTPVGGKPGPLTLKAWVEAVKAKGETLIPSDDPVFAYADEIALPREFLHLAWREFRTRHGDGSKRYRDWRSVFRKAVRGNWLKLWYLSADQYQLTTVGLQAQRAHGVKEAA